MATYTHDLLDLSGTQFDFLILTTVTCDLLETHVVGRVVLEVTLAAAASITPAQRHSRS